MILRLVRAGIALKLRRRDSDMRHPAYEPMLVGPPRPPAFKRSAFADDDDLFDHRHDSSRTDLLNDWDITNIYH